MKKIALILLAMIATPALSHPIGRLTIIDMPGEVRPGFVVCDSHGNCVVPRADWNLHALIVSSDNDYAMFSVGREVYGVPAKAVLIDCPSGLVQLGNYPFACPR